MLDPQFDSRLHQPAVVTNFTAALTAAGVHTGQEATYDHDQQAANMMLLGNMYVEHATGADTMDRALRKLVVPNNRGAAGSRHHPV